VLPIVLEESNKVNPSHTGVLLPGAGVAGVACTVTDVTPLGPIQPPRLMSTEYVPEAATVAPVIVGSSSVEVKLFGPIQLYVAPATLLALRERVCPEHIVVLPMVVGV
jgi:hypothetical protein